MPCKTALLVAPPPEMVTVKLAELEYPVPGFVIMTCVTTFPLMIAVPAAPVPPPPENEITVFEALM